MSSDSLASLDTSLTRLLCTVEWDFVETLAYREQTPSDADFVRLMYLSRLRKYKHTEEHALVRRRLVEDYSLGDNPDVLFSFADALYTQLRWADCYAVTSRYVPPQYPVSCSVLNPEDHIMTEFLVLLTFTRTPCRYI